jgi:hypothetical protein
VKRLVLACALLVLPACGGGEDGPAAAATSASPSASPTPTLSAADALACDRFGPARDEAGRILGVLLDPANAAIDPGLPKSLLDIQAGKMQDAAVTAGAAAADMRTTADALRQVRFLQQRPEVGSVRAFDLLAERVTEACNLPRS